MALWFTGMTVARDDRARILLRVWRMATASASPLRRAQRYSVQWPTRVRRLEEERWHKGRTVNIGVSGVLLETRGHYKIGERVEVEIEFLTGLQTNTIVNGVGHVVRRDRSLPTRAAIAFNVECNLGPMEQQEPQPD